MGEDYLLARIKGCSAKEKGNLTDRGGGEIDGNPSGT